MAFEIKPGQGTFFRAKDKQNPNMPDYEGQINFGGVMYRIAGWIKEGKSGKWMSLAITEKGDKPATAKPATRAPSEDIPF